MMSSSNLRLPALLAAASLFLAACGGSDPDPAPQPSAKRGVFVVNEGNFGQGNGDVSFFGDGTTDPSDTTRRAFQAANARPLGDVLQHLALINDSIVYAVVNNDNKIEAFRLSDYTSAASISGLHLPRQAAVAPNGKVYVSNWGSFDGSVPAYVAVIDASTHRVEDTVALGHAGAGHLLVHEGRLYVANNFSSTISVLNTANNRLEATWTVGDAPQAMAVRGGKLWVVCGGYYDDWLTPDENEETAPSMASVDLATGSVQTAPLGSLGSHPSLLALLPGEGLAVALDGGIWRVSEQLQREAAPFVSGRYAYGLGASPDGRLYVGDAGDFASEGTVYIYNAQGTLLESFGSGGVGPNGFVWAE